VRVGDDALVVLLDAELEVLEGVGDVLLEALDRRELFLDVGALAKDLLRLGLVVPEVGRPGLFVQLRELSFQLRDVKDPSLAPRGAVEGP